MPKNEFSVISQSFLFFWVAVQNSFFDNLAKKRASKRHYKHMGFQQTTFLPTDVRHKASIFGPTKPQTRNSSNHLFFVVLVCQ